MKKPILLTILDGYGLSDDSYGNAIMAANTPNLDKMMSEHPFIKISASGLDVGLPSGQMGNSEVGHTNIGAGRVVYQELTRITKAAEDGSLFENKALKSAFRQAKESGRAVHIMGLLSNGGVHSHINHLFNLLDFAKKEGIEKLFVHCFMDGRDCSPTSGTGFLKELEQKLTELGIGQIASVSGRYYAMDRDNRWERVEEAYKAVCLGAGIEKYGILPSEAVLACYENGETDEFIKPLVFIKDFKIEQGDSAIFFNFRPDRARELTRSIVDPDFASFKRDFVKTNFVCYTLYDATIAGVEVAFSPLKLTNTLCEIVSNHTLHQLRIAETEKYAHVTFFMSGGVEKPYEGEDRILVPSPKVATYDLLPQMSAPKVCQKLLDAIDKDLYDLIILNFANCDMVGHSGIMEAVIKAVETVDICMGELYDKIIEKDGLMLVTADHGNAEKLLEKDGSPFTAHTTNPVPLILISKDKSLGLRENADGRLSDIAPSILDLLEISKPDEMTGVSLILHK